MNPELQTALQAHLDDSSLTMLLGDGSGDGVIAASDMHENRAFPVVVLQYAGGRRTTETATYEDWHVLVLDRDNGYFRIAGVVAAAKTLLNKQSLALDGDEKCFEIEWLADLPWDNSRAFRAEVGGALFRVYLSRSEP